MLKNINFKSLFRFKTSIIILSYLLLTIIFTWPILPNMHIKVTDAGDPFFVSWVVDSELESIKSGDIKNFWNGGIFYPYKNTIAHSDHSLTLTLQALPVSFFTENPIFIINYLQLLSFFLSAISAYFLSYHYTKNRKAAFFSGFLFAFASYHIGQISHIQISSYQYIPLVILFFEKFLSDQKIRNGLLAVLFFLLNAFVSVYHLGFVLFPIIIIFIVRIFNKEIKLNAKFWLKSSGLLFLAILGLAPMLYPYYKVTKELNATKSIEEHIHYSADVIDFGLSPDTNLLLQNFAEKIKSGNPQEAWVEHTLYFGIISVSLAVLGFYGWKKYGNDVKVIVIRFNSTQLAYLLTMLVSILLIFGPYLLGESRKVKLPYYFLYHYVEIFKGIRVPTRASILIVLAISILVGFFISKLQKSEISDKKKNILTILLFIILFLEHLSAPLKLIKPEQINQSLYYWTKENIKQEDAILHLPFGQELQYQRGMMISHKRTVNGYSGVFPESYIKLANEFGNTFTQNPKNSLEIASNIGVDYLVLHKTYFTKQNIDFNKLVKEVENIKEIKFVKEIGGDRIYDIKSLENAKFGTAKLDINIELTKSKKLEITIKNPDNIIWVNKDLERLIITVNYYQDDKLTKTKKLDDFIKPLFLKPQETQKVELDLSNPLFTKYNRVEIFGN